jgi:hypothetical protein
LRVSLVDKPTSKTGDKESDMSGLYDSKNASGEDNKEVTFTDSEYHLSNSQNDLNTLDDNKSHPSADKGVSKIEEKDKLNKHVDIQNEKESKKDPSSIFHL